MDNQFMASLQSEGISPQTESETPVKEETPAAPPAENKPNDGQQESSPDAQAKEGETVEQKPDAKQEPPAEDKKPEEKEPDVFHAFHEHPRWIATQEELKELREFKEMASPILESLKKDDKEETDEEVAPWFKTMFGTDNPEVWKQYRAYNKHERQEIKRELLAEMQSQETQRSDEQKKWDKWVDAKTVEVGDKYHIDLSPKKDGKENTLYKRLLEVTLEYLPTDKDGNIDFDKGYQIMQKIDQTTPPKSADKTVDEKKKIADATMGNKNPTEDKKDFKTSADFRGKSMHDLINP